MLLNSTTLLKVIQTIIRVGNNKGVRRTRIRQSHCRISRGGKALSLDRNDFVTLSHLPRNQTALRSAAILNEQGALTFAYLGTVEKLQLDCLACVSTAMSRIPNNFDYLMHKKGDEGGSLM